MLMQVYTYWDSKLSITNMEMPDLSEENLHFFCVWVQVK